MTTEPPRDIARVVFAVVFILALVGLSLRILAPFLPAIIWATTIVVATWPALLRVQARLGNRRSLAVLVMTGAFFLLFFLPLTLAVGAAVTHADAIAAGARSLLTLDLPPLPAWIANLPFVGPRIAAGWAELVAAGGSGLATELRPYASKAAMWFVGTAGSVGALLLQFLLTLVVTALFYASGEGAADAVGRFARRLAGAQGDTAVRLAAQSIRAVALGVVVTALLQAILAALGLLVAGIPFVAVWTIAMFMLSLAQLGPTLILVPAVIWLYMSGHSGWGTFLLVWSILIIPLDNIVRPMLIKRGANLSLPLVFAGVVGGLVAFGLIGIFIGPVVLAVGSTLLDAWIELGLGRTTASATAPADAR
jgi:predicted PurR-regulated permease PerM